MWQAKLIAYSESSITGKKIETWELVYPRMIHSEVMTHKMLSKNAASSRAIPIPKVIEMVRENPAMPAFWGKNQAGMQSFEELNEEAKELVQESWLMAAHNACVEAERMYSYGAHKQIANRVLEPFQWMKTVMTGTEWENFYWLRRHPMADPTFYKLSDMMYNEREKATPVVLHPGEWHLPYYTGGYWSDLGDGRDTYGVSLQDALAISMSCCAQVSYRTLDDTIEKAERVVSRLNLSGEDNEPVHASPSEHQATPMKVSKFGQWNDSVNLCPFVETWEDGVTAYHKELGFMSGNLAGWIQNRQLINGHTKW